MDLVANSPRDSWRHDYRRSSRALRNSLVHGERIAVMRLDLSHILGIIATLSLVVITIAVGHIAGWW